MHRFWGLVFGVVLLGIFVLTAVSPMFGWWLPKGVSTYSWEIDRLFYLILAIVTFFYVLTEILLVWNIVKFGAGNRRSGYSHGDKTLEIVWSIVPAIILVLIAVLQVKAWANIKYPTNLAESIANGEPYLQLGVEARQWEFRVRYPSIEHVAEWDRDPAIAREDFKRRLDERIDDVWVVNDVHVWKNQRVLLYLRLRDVIHSVFFPNLRLKQDIMPGRVIPSWFEATETNTRPMDVDGKKVWQDGWRMEGDKWVQDKHSIFDLVCTQYCGTRHSLMRGRLFVHDSKEDFLAWLKNAHELSNVKQATPSSVSATP